DRWTTRAGLILLSIILLSLALPPLKQFYLAWVGLVPWLLVVSSTSSKKAAFLWSWFGGAVFFLINMWWLSHVTGPGVIALVIYLGVFFALNAWVLVGCGIVARGAQPRFDEAHRGQAAGVARIVGSVVVIAVAWTALEYVRGNWSMFGNQGLPWLYLGDSQVPLLTMCQIADIGGVYAVTFWVVVVNAV